MSADPLTVAAGSYCAKPGSRRAARAKMLASIDRSTALKPITSTRYCSFTFTLTTHGQQAENGIRIRKPVKHLFGKHPVEQWLQRRDVGTQARQRRHEVLRQHLHQ